MDGYESDSQSVSRSPAAQSSGSSSSSTAASSPADSDTQPKPKTSQKRARSGSESSSGGQDASSRLESPADSPAAQPRTLDSDSDSSSAPSQQPAPPPIVRHETDMSCARPNLGSKRLYVKLPNFLSIGTQEYDPQFYEAEIHEDETQDYEGRVKLKLRVENTIRWRKEVDENGEEQVESNARIVEWSDGSMSLYLGSEIFDANEKSIGESSHLFVRLGNRQGLQGQAIFNSKLSIRPYSTESFTHRKLTLSLADRSQKTQKVRMLNNPGQDPEARLDELSRREDDKMKATIRRETKQRRIQERSQYGGPNASYLEPDYDEEDEDGAISISAIKRGAIARTTYDSDESSESQEKVYSDDSDPEFGKVQHRSDRKKKQVVEESDEDE